MAVPIDFGFQSNAGRHGHDGAAKLINCYAETRGQEGKAPIVVYAAHGLKAFGSGVAGTTGTRGMFPLGDVFYWVVGKQLRKVDSLGTSTLIGGLADDGRVEMARNSKAETPQIAIVTKGGLRFILENDVLTPIADTDLPPPNSVAYLDGYMVYGIADGRIFYSEINSADDIGALNFLEAEAAPDGLKTVITLQRELFALGDDTIQSFQNTGGTTNPITPLLGRPIQRGCLTGASAAILDNTLVWVADDRTVRRLNGYTPVKISTPEVDELLRKEGTPDNITADIYSMQGHEFYVLSGTDFTRVYDAATGLWHERISKLLTRWRGQSIIKFGDKWICGDKDDGTLYEIDADTYDENGSDLVMAMQSRPLHQFPDTLIFDALYLDLITGQGLNSTDSHDADPQITLVYSDDGGKSWSNELSADLGKIGEYQTEVAFYGLGETSKIGRTFRFEMSANVVKGFLGASADLERVAA